ncbi:MAG TPA: gephyrin-like molybdotransferase Glp [Burkholderiales bacterium]|nr:gephyrin-like molybdotransferase Glp [Burkholderiales bacterium]
MTTRSLRELSCADDYDPDSMPVAKAREFIQAYLTPITGTEKVNIRAALGRVLAEDIVSSINVPAHVNSAMDGYAVRFKDLSAQGETILRMIGTALAGKPFAGRIGDQQCVRIMTGAVLPDGADTVIMQEHASPDGQMIRFRGAQKAGQNIRQAGEDLAIGQVVLKSGKHIRPAELGLIASLGIAEIAVRRRLRVAFFSTGDELRSIGSPLAEGQIYDSNRYTLYGMLTNLGAEILDMGVVKDDPASLEQALSEAAATADVVITSGGVSVGEADYIKELLSRLGEVVFWKIAMKPGRPLAYGKIGKSHFFGLPGNPVSVMVTFYQFVRDALLILMGRKGDIAVPVLKANCNSALKKAPGRTEFQRGILSQDAKGVWSVRVTGEQGSGILRSMSEANCFIVLPENQGNVVPDTLVDVQVLEGLV